jgi:glycosyltransferase involved in cell wall biosynthesis
MDKILYDARWIGPHGIGRFADELQKRLPSLVPFHARRRPWHPLDPVLLGAWLLCHRQRLFFSPGYNSPVPYSGRFVFTLHDLNHLRVPANSSAAKRAYYRHIIRPACHRAVLVLTVSEFSRREIAAWAELGDGKIVNVGNGVGYPFVATGTKHAPGYSYLLYVGSRKPHKNLPRLLKAFAISEIHPDVRLTIAGEPTPSVVAQIKQLGLEARVEFARSSSNEDLASLYRGALAFVFPSLYEGFGLPPLEAMACGTPVLASNAAALPEIVGNAGLLVDPLDAEAIADGIRRLVQDSVLCAELRQKGFARARGFTWEETARKTWEALQTAAEG